MAIQHQNQTRMAELMAQRTKIKKRLAEHKEELRRVQRNVDRADEALSNVEYEIDIETIRSWGSTPDLAALLDGTRSMAFYQALVALAEQRGFHVMGQSYKTGQVGLHFGMDRAGIGGVERVAEAIRYFAVGLKSVPGLGCCFGLVTQDEDCAYELAYNKHSGCAVVVKMAFGREQARTDFATLEDALRHVEKHHWCENVIDIDQGLVLDGPETSPSAH